MAGFATRERGKLILACGTGKNVTAFRLAVRVAEEDGESSSTLPRAIHFALFANSQGMDRTKAS
ncbi:hypothetical protein [Corynebacterium sp. 045007]|uniref:hypothetical protein n=1 Tax=Corynebacterium sp. 045007 TaxID=3156078 RepID=UPI00345C109F